MKSFTLLCPLPDLVATSSYIRINFSLFISCVILEDLVCVLKVGESERSSTYVLMSFEKVSRLLRLNCVLDSNHT